MKKIYFLVTGFLFFLPFFAGAVQFASPTKMTTLYDFLKITKDISLMIVSPLAVIALLIAAFFILKSQGKSEEVNRGKKFLTFGLIGLAVVILGAGSSTFIMNVTGLKPVPGIILPFDKSLEAMDKYLENTKNIKDPSLQTLSAMKKQIDACSFGAGTNINQK